VKIPKGGPAFGALKGFFEENPEKKFYLVWGTVFVAILAVSAGVFAQLRSAVLSARGEMSTFRASVQRMEALNVTPANYLERLEEIRRSVEMESNRFVKPLDMPTVIARISESAQRNEITLRKIGSGNAAPLPELKAYTRMALTMEISGNFFRVGDFLTALKKEIPWFFSWEQVRLRAVSAGDGSVSGTVEMAFYSKAK
jgi:hypothetical protein